MKKILSFLGFLLVPFSASAHVKWFVDTKDVIATAHDQTTFYSWGSKEVIIWSVIVCVAVLFFSLINKKLHAPKALIAYGLKHEKTINRVAEVIVGIFLVTVSFIWKAILIPEVAIAGNLSLFFGALQVLIGAMFIFNIKPRIASALLGLFCLSLIFTTGVVAFLENMMLFTLAIYFFIVNSEPDSKVFRLNKHAVEIVRIGTGVSLIVLAFTEKLLYPELSIQFLQVYHWNFMISMFPWFTDKLFVLSTGFAEIIFGILFIMGYITRITTILIALFFATSVITMAIGSHAWEVEDLVVYSAAILFIFYGHGRTKFFHF